MTTPFRLAVLDTHPIQYFSPLYRRLAVEDDIDITVHYCSRWGVDDYRDPGFGIDMKWDRPLLDGFDHVFMPNVRSRDQIGGFGTLVNPAIVGHLRRGNFDALWLNGYRHATHALALAAARASGIPVLYRSESSLTHDRLRPPPLAKRLAKTAFLRALFAQVRGFLAIGTANQDFYRHYGVAGERIFHVPYAVDNEFFVEVSERERLRRAETRAEMAFPADAVVFLFAAKMISQKRPLEMLEAFDAMLRAGVDDACLLMVGDGPLRLEAERFVATRSIPHVVFTGFLNQGELPRAYAASDVLVRPDGVYKGDWGLSVNEAMASGLAVVTTDAIAATDDLVAGRGTGVVVRDGDVADLTRAMESLAREPAGCRAMGARAREVISSWSYEECVEGVRRALAYVAARPQPTVPARTRTRTRLEGAR